jgi:lambda repressor-like predicted transcriptional regulator
MTRDWNRERIILRRHAEGETLVSIAKDFGLTRERVRQIVKRNQTAAPGDSSPAAGTPAPRK